MIILSLKDKMEGFGNDSWSKKFESSRDDYYDNDCWDYSEYSEIKFNG